MRRLPSDHLVDTDFGHRLDRVLVATTFGQCLYDDEARLTSRHEHAFAHRHRHPATCHLGNLAVHDNTAPVTHVDRLAGAQAPYIGSVPALVAFEHDNVAGTTDANASDEARNSGAVTFSPNVQCDVRRLRPPRGDERRTQHAAAVTCR